MKKEGLEREKASFNKINKKFFVGLVLIAFVFVLMNSFVVGWVMGAEAVTPVDTNKPEEWYKNPAGATELLKTDPNKFLDGAKQLMTDSQSGHTSPKLNQLWTAILEKGGIDSAVGINDKGFQELWDKLTYDNAAKTIGKLKEKGKLDDLVKKLSSIQIQRFVKAGYTGKNSVGEDLGNAKTSLEAVRRDFLDSAYKLAVAADKTNGGKNFFKGIISNSLVDKVGSGGKQDNNARIAFAKDLTQMKDAQKDKTDNTIFQNFAKAYLETRNLKTEVKLGKTAGLILEANDKGEFILKNKEGGSINLDQQVDKYTKEIGVVGDNVPSYKDQAGSLYIKTDFHQDGKSTSVYFKTGSVGKDGFYYVDGKKTSVHLGYSSGGSLIIGKTNNGVTEFTLSGGAAIGVITPSNSEIARVQGEARSVSVGPNGIVQLTGSKDGIEYWDMNPTTYGKVINNYFAQSDPKAASTIYNNDLKNDQKSIVMTSLYGKFFGDKVTFNTNGANILKQGTNLQGSSGTSYIINGIDGAIMGSGDKSLLALNPQTNKNIALTVGTVATVDGTNSYNDNYLNFDTNSPMGQNIANILQATGAGGAVGPNYQYSGGGNQVPGATGGGQPGKQPIQPNPTPTNPISGTAGTVQTPLQKWTAGFTSTESVKVGTAISSQQVQVMVYDSTKNLYADAQGKIYEKYACTSSGCLWKSIGTIK